MRKFLVGLVMLFPLIGTAVSQVSQENKVDALAHAIARTEGYFVRGTIPNRLRNPGDIRSHHRHDYVGQVGLYRGYVVFKSDRDGWNALRGQIERIVDGTSKHYTQEMTFAQVARTYAEDPRWGRTVCKILKVTPQTTVAEYFDLEPRIVLTGGSDAATMRLLLRGEHPMPALSWVPTLPAYI